MSHHAAPRLRRAPLAVRHTPLTPLAALATGAVLLLAPAPGRAQGAFTGEVYAGVPGQAAHERALQYGQFSLHTTSAGAGAAISANGRTGRLGILATTEAKNESAQGTLHWKTALTVTRTTTLGVLQPFQVYLDGSFGRTPYNIYAGSARARAGVTARMAGDWNWYSTGLEFLPERVPSDDPNDPGAEDRRGSETVWVPIPAGLPGSTVRIDLNFTYQVNANYGWDADFSHTARLFVPTVQGLTWSSDDGTLAEQARPAWAAHDRVSGEVSGGPTTTAPEPATLALVAGGAVALGGVARRRPLAR